ncbi:MAG: hypothetical protein QF415_10915 [Candidatus Undinarchaeales archaeon]|jgi:hypothetical protein|nr:hypothetical protein [Candidatus Undinarchaeales archaeon]MDP7494323.1 hypothetical protein [Candidatus Undinarchaeales archaeon]
MANRRRSTCRPQGPRSRILTHERGQQLIIEAVLTFGAGVMVLGMVATVFSFTNEKVVTILIERYIEEIADYTASAILIVYESGKHLKSPTPDPIAVSELRLDIPEMLANEPYLMHVSHDRRKKAIVVSVKIPGKARKDVLVTGLEDVNVSCCNCKSWKEESSTSEFYGEIFPIAFPSGRQMVVRLFKPYRMIGSDKVYNALCIEELQ